MYWLTALYKTIWKPRNQETYNAQFTPSVQKRKTRRKTKKIINIVIKKREARLKRLKNPKRKINQSKKPNKKSKRSNTSTTQNPTHKRKKPKITQKTTREVKLLH